MTSGVESLYGADTWCT